jgi:hypothetical protein
LGKAVKDLTAKALRALRKKELVLFMASTLCDLGVLRASAVIFFHPRILYSPSPKSANLNSANPRRIRIVFRIDLGRVYRKVCPAFVVLHIGSHAVAVFEHFVGLFRIQDYLNKLALNVAEIVF